MATRKVTLKVNISCRKCIDKLVRQIHEVKGVQKVEIVGQDCPHFVIFGDMQVEDILKAIERKKKCIIVESVEEIPPPEPETKPEEPPAQPEEPPPAPEESKPEEPPAPQEETKPEEPPAEPPAAPPAETPPVVVEPPDDNNCIVVSTSGVKHFPSKFPDVIFGKGSSLVISIKNLVICPSGGSSRHGCNRCSCDSCC